MTKTYIKPETKTIKVELQLLQQTSVEKDDTTEVTNETEVLGKEFSFSFFGEEELEEEY